MRFQGTYDPVIEDHIDYYKLNPAGRNTFSVTIIHLIPLFTDFSQASPRNWSTLLHNLPRFSPSKLAPASHDFNLSLGNNYFPVSTIIILY